MRLRRSLELMKYFVFFFLLAAPLDGLGFFSGFYLFAFG